MKLGMITLTPTGDGPAVQTFIQDGKYTFLEENGPIAGDYTVRIIRELEREPVPEGTPKKDADFIPETGFKNPMPMYGWTTKVTISPDQDVTVPVDFNVDEAQPAPPS